MELRQLEYFVAVADAQSFTRAAAKLHLAQPGISAQVRRLEEDLGQRLLDRSGRQVRLTAAGAAVLPYARAALAAAAGAQVAADELSGLVRGHVDMGMVVACGALQVPEMLAAFHRLHPAVGITLSEADSDHLLEAVRSGQLDLAFVGLGMATPAAVAIQVVVEEPLVAAVGVADELAAAGAISLEALCAHPLITLPRGTGLRACLDDACRALGLRPQVAMEASDPRMLAELAGRGLGVAIVPASVATVHAGHVRQVAITSPMPRGRIAIAWREGDAASPAARALIAHARRVMGAEGAG